MSWSSTTASARLQPDDDPLLRAHELIGAGRAGDAVVQLDSVHAAGRGGLLLQAARVEARIAAGDNDGALAIAREAARLYPGVAMIAVALGEALRAAGHLATAIGEFQRALRLDPDSTSARYALGSLWLEAGEAEKAAEAFASLRHEEEPRELAEKLAEIDRMRTRPRADPRYVRHLFDQFSVDYDVRMLGQLGYGAPQILRSLAALIGIAGENAILDLGCGTGLSGAAFSDLARRLDGIDLSPAMIAKARARGIYDDLWVGDLETASGDRERRYDLLVAADTLVYLGDLANVFAVSARTLRARGNFLFTVERKEGEGYELGPKRRWRHSE